ncbi:hypothetical protein CBR_g22030 [Chara braunii]|uniref:THH1/TOM1/TOM3 domain-containing protein n=1 Tax=Chara braunii TaxID=69332 RepID=A0A388L234_CHABU|nr:hypothetical protein CBR_g22030 [Chara braunii]|eukprot:GBG76282.1 hypothetical protein CBR_g22030 [Chara braunii]
MRFLVPVTSFMSLPKDGRRNGLLLGPVGADSWGDWWTEVNESHTWQHGTFETLAALYLVVGIVALVQLIRIHWRVPEFGWTTQKVFHLLNFVVNTLRALVFIFREPVQALSVRVLGAALLDLPGLLFFTTYTLLVLFWAEIYHQAKRLPTDYLKPVFFGINVAVYGLQGGIWVFMYGYPSAHDSMDFWAKIFFAVISFMAALGFIVYGGCLFNMLRTFPIESKGRRKKLSEVGFVTLICFICFTFRGIVVSVSAFEKSVDLDVLNHPILNFIYYMIAEIIPSALVLYILRKLPPRRMTYHPIR